MAKIDDQPEDPFEKLVLDEDFVRAAEHKEQSARARMLSARWKRTPPKDTGWRPPVTPPKRRRLRGRWQAPVFVVLAVGLVLASLNAKALHDVAFGKAPGAGSATEGAPVGQAVAPALTASPTAAPPTSIADTTPTMQNPFAGSPADKWPSGAAGIALPAAQPVGAFSAGTVAKDEQRVKTFLMAAYLDPKTLHGGYPQAVLDMLDPFQRNWMTTGLAHPTAAQNASMWVSRFNPAVAILVSDDVRVQGVTTLASDGDHGLLVRTDYVFVYAAHPAGSTDEVERTIARRTLTFRFFDPARYQVTAGTVSIEDSKGNTADDRCDLHDGYLTPYFQISQATGTASAPAPSGSPIDPYDLSKPVPAKQSDCALDSRN
ncbi:hypothetical protein ABIA32_004845 [Streptacidiphilus sp. MAP12-20]|uniref:SCO2583/SCO2584 N-terminal domain-containing protein n=1 Tax=Streptacidiphilus sp. MAP12-20 TaxID=3156299 RepID=UPI003511971E